MKQRDAKIIALEMIADTVIDSIRNNGDIARRLTNYPPKDSYRIIDQLEHIVGRLNDRAGKMKERDRELWLK